jgi:hypothetical protein
MAVAIHVGIRDKDAADDAPISVEHVFYGRDEADADKKRLAHLAGCENFAKAEADGRVRIVVEEGMRSTPTFADFEPEEDDEAEEEEEPEAEEGG